MTFDELQIGYKIRQPFFYGNKVYFKLGKGCFYIQPEYYIGDFEFIEKLFDEQRWEQIELYKEKILPLLLGFRANQRIINPEEKVAIFEQLQNMEDEGL